MDALFGCFEDTLEPDEYARYLEVRREREKSGVVRKKNKIGGLNVAYGVDPVYFHFSEGYAKTSRKLNEAERRVSRRIKEQHQRNRQSQNQISQNQIRQKQTVIQQLIKGEYMGSLEDNTAVYTVKEMVDKFGVKMQTIGAFVRHGTIPAESVVAQGVYNKNIIDKLVAEGLFTMTANQRYKKKKKTGQLIKKRGVLAGTNPKKQLQGDSGIKKRTPAPSTTLVSKTTLASQGLPHNKTFSAPADLSHFWSSHANLAIAILTQPEQTRSLVLRCMDDLFVYLAK